MSSQYLIESKINDNLKVLSNEYLMSTIRKNLEYKNNYSGAPARAKRARSGAP